MYSYNITTLNDFIVKRKSDFPYAKGELSRYIGSLVVDFHRNLLKGGIFLYPAGPGYPRGKLRLAYECNPIAFLAEQAGGKATDGSNRILDISPESAHQRVPFYVGCRSMVDVLEQMIRDNPDM